jgi:hypothetical protein
MQEKDEEGAFFYRRPAGKKTGLSGAALSLRPRRTRGPPKGGPHMYNA